MAMEGRQFRIRREDRGAHLSRQTDSNNVGIDDVRGTAVEAVQTWLMFHGRFKDIPFLKITVIWRRIQSK